MKSRIFSNVCFLFVAIAIIFSLDLSSPAQEVTGSIIGNVHDSNGAAVAGATVTITNTNKNNLVVRTVTTNEEGDFNAPNLDPGTYTVTVEAANFKKSVNTDLKLEVGSRHTLDLALEAGNVSETVTVEADAVAVNLSTPTTGTTINGDQVREIPINNRNFVQLVALAPGVSNDLADQVYVGTTNPDGQANTINISVNGGRSSQNTFTVDGADVTDRGSNITIQAYPSVDSIGEFKVLRSLYPAESGRSGGGQVNIITRSGGNRFSGSFFEFVRNDAFNANNFLINGTTSPPFGREDNGLARRPPFNYNNYGFTVGGPVYFLNFGDKGPNRGMFRRWDKTFFFFSQEWRKDSRFTSAATVSVPDAALRNGVFPVDVCINRSNVVTENCNVGNPGRLTAGTPIPLAMYSPAALAYLNGIYRNLPLPNAGTAANPYALVTALANKSDFNQSILKIDHQFNDKWSAYYRYERDEIPTIDGNALFSSGSGLPDVSTTSTNSPGRTQTFQTTYTIGSNIILEGRYNYSYGAILSENIGTLSLLRTQVPVTLPFANQRDRNPSITNNGFTNLTSFGPYNNFSDKHNYTGSLTYIFGNHAAKFGAVWSRYRKNENALAGNNEGLFSAFPSTVATGVTNNALNQNIQRWASFLVGNVTTFSQASFDYTADLRQNAFEAYAQDEWRIRSNLTVYFGVRYSFFGAPYDRNGRLSNFIPELFDRNNQPAVTGLGNRISGVAGVNTGNWCNGMIVNTQNFTSGPPQFNCTATASPWGKYVIDVPKNDFAPRVGLAWDPFGKGTTSVRMGYGIYHEQVLNGTFLQNIGANVPYQQTANLTNVRLDNPAGGATVSATVINLRAVQSDWETPYMQHWSLDVQHQLFKNVIVTAGYYGSKGTNLIGLTELNSLPPGLALGSMCAPGANYFGQAGAFTPVQCQPAGYAFRNSANVVGNPNRTGAACSATTTVAGCNTDLLILDQLRPFRGYRSIAMVQPRYGSNYHSFQFSGQYRFSGASQLNVAYTWAKNLTDSQNDRTASPQNSYFTKAEWARAALDRRHIFNFNYVYELPFFSKQEGLMGKILGGYQMSGIVTYQTGLGFTAVTSNLDYAGLGIINANPTARPNVTCDPNDGAPHTQQQWFNTSCFQLNPGNDVVGLPNTPGNSARNIIEGPATFRVDFTLAKNIRFGERMVLQLRGEVFNILNKTNFRGFVGTPNSLNVTSANFGTIGSVRDPRTMQFGAKFSW